MEAQQPQPQPQPQPQAAGSRDLAYRWSARRSSSTMCLFCGTATSVRFIHCACPPTSVFHQGRGVFFWMPCLSTEAARPASLLLFGWCLLLSTTSSPSPSDGAVSAPRPNVPRPTLCWWPATGVVQIDATHQLLVGGVVKLGRELPSSIVLELPPALLASLPFWRLPLQQPLVRILRVLLRRLAPRRVHLRHGRDRQ